MRSRRRWRRRVLLTLSAVPEVVPERLGLSGMFYFSRQRMPRNGLAGATTRKEETKVREVRMEVGGGGVGFKP